ncbi:uncharacterized protein LOC126842046 [Adelges cooleyi]|uniref:uncharacterized protein LOC126842046 n=1 Tax=Adelges cooleyi TaxID=133065 RepID=UPI00217F68CC|nr:uncharacterized protein LOC126842046 [Adelges cooleyi]
MHFKIAVILCALYFVTMTQSVGINQDQIKKVVDLVKKNENAKDQITPENIRKLLTDLGVEEKNLEGCTYEADTKDGKKVQSIIVFLTKNKKTEDLWTLKNLSSQEVIVYLSLFIHYDKEGGDLDGLVDSDELKKIIEALSLNDGEKEILTGKFQDDPTVNFAEFLYGYLDVKQIGRGLDMEQITNLSNIKKFKTNDDCIQPDKITEFIQGLSIIDGQHEKWEFERFQKYALELQELVVVSAEYNKTADEKKRIVIPSPAVRDYVSGFAFHDTNQDGLLCGKELDDIVDKHLKGATAASILVDGNDNGDGCLDILEILTVTFKQFEQLKTHCPCHK